MINHEKMKITRKKTMIQDIWQWSRARHLPIICICILNFIVSGSSLVIAIATRGLIDSAMGHDSRQILFCAILMSGAVLMIRGCGLLSGLLTAKTDAELLQDLRMIVLKEMLNL